MSAWMEVRCLRVPVEALGFDGDPITYADEHAEEEAFDRGEWPDRKFPFLTPAPTERAFLDLVLSEKVTEKRGCSGKTRALTAREKAAYLPLFRKHFPQLREEKVRCVHYRYYDGCEAPDYYEDPPR